MPRYQVTAHIYDSELFHEPLLKALRFELEAGSLFLAHDDALIRLKAEYPDKAIAVTAEEI